MSWKLIKAIQREGADLRLILPFGLNLQPGDVVSVGKDGSFTLEGNSFSLLGIKAGATRAPSPASVALSIKGGKNVKAVFRTSGTGSTLFPELPKADAGFDISFDSSDSFLVAFTGRVVNALPDVNRFRKPILDAYGRKAWNADWVLIHTVSTVKSLTLLASRNANTNIALKVSADVQANATLEVQLTSEAQVMATSNEITQCIVSEQMPVFCAGIRVTDHWWNLWGKPGLGTLATGKEEIPDVATASDFFEDMDKGIPGGNV